MENNINIYLLTDEIKRLEADDLENLRNYLDGKTTLNEYLHGETLLVEDSKKELKAYKAGFLKGRLSAFDEVHKLIKFILS